jgi:hypothetical protein
VAVLVWDKVGERVYQTGVDKGVLYLQDNTSAVWNGLTSVVESSTTTLKEFFYDGVKYLGTLTPGDFSGKLNALTYPDELDKVTGVVSVAPGLSYYDQPPTSFNLTYRTRIGNDLDGTDHGYKIHLLYNVLASYDDYTFETLKDELTPIEFSWSLSGTPPKMRGYRPTVHISIDSNETDSDILEYLEDILYGTDTTNPYFPSISEILDMFQSLGNLIIVDNGDGTWQAIDQAGEYITMVNDTTFRIDNADATYLNPTTYEISSTIGTDE